MKRVFLIYLCTIVLSCNDDNKITRLLNSTQKENIIKGAYLAGEDGSKKFVTLLLKDANDIRTSTNIRFKGYNVYQQKMIALRKIFGQTPPVPITEKPDSVIIRFYTNLEYAAGD